MYFNQIKMNLFYIVKTKETIQKSPLRGLGGLFLLFPLWGLGGLFTTFAQPVTQTFNASGTYTVPAGYTATVKIEAWGGGGSASVMAGGGGGGAFAGTTINIVLLPGTYTVTVGAGGAGTNGGNSSFVISTGNNVVANGGIRGDNGGAGGAASTGSNITSFSGGDGSLDGGGGGSATATAAGGNGSGSSGGTGQGNGGNNSQNGFAPGGGGGRGRPGGRGQVIVTVVSQALPVNLLYFKAAVSQNTESNAVRFSWATASELNAQNFKVERSRDLKTFELVATVKAAGNSKDQQEYSLSDPKPYFGTSYYRLSQIDFDGSFYFYNPVAVIIEDKDLPFGVFPNPVNSKVFSLKVESADEAQVSLHNLLGQALPIQTLKVSETVLELKPQSELPTGTYVVTVQGIVGKKSYKVVLSY